MSALDKVLALHGDARAAADPAGDLVAAAASCLDELIVLLAAKDSDDDDGPPWMKKKGGKGKGSKSGDENDDDDSEPDDDDDDDTKSKKKSKKKVAASAAALAAGARIALSGLAAPDAGYDWVEATAGPATLSLSKDKKPYGDVPYADPGYQDDGKHRYPLDKDHIHAAIAYFSKASNRSKYSASQVKSMWGKIKAAASRLGVDMKDDKVAASLDLELAYVLELAASGGEGGVPMHHPPFSGRHNHPHTVMNVHSHAHDHNADSRHQCGVTSYGDY